MSSSSNWLSMGSSETANKELGNEFKGKIIENNDEKYMVLYKLGFGSFSSVWLSYSIKDKKLVAIKIYHPKDYEDSYNEILIYDKINNSSINKKYLLTSLDVFEINPIIDDVNYYNDDNTINKHKIIILPLMGISSYDILDYYEDGLECKLIYEITKQLLLGLREFEKLNLCHTDLKPENILINGLTYKMNYIENYINNLNILINTNNDLLIEINKNILNEIELYDKNNSNGDKLMDIYLDNIEIKICDFNLSIEYDENKLYSDYQTRYYRAPELILGYNFNRKSDYWSIPCIIFELMTGDILFDPEKTDNITTDIAHVYLFIELLGNIPCSMIKDCPNYNKLFHNDKLININKKIKLFKLDDVLKEYNLDENNIYFKKLKTLINDMLIIEPKSRNDLNYYLNKYF